jgi:hypothetical protein
VSERGSEGAGEDGGRRGRGRGGERERLLYFPFFHPEFFHRTTITSFLFLFFSFRDEMRIERNRSCFFGAELANLECVRSREGSGEREKREKKERKRVSLASEVLIC